jgi:TRAP-type C4-dicarboxylate transport system permease small subunit
MALRILHWLRTVNRVIALLVGAGLLLCAGLVVLDVVLRRVGMSLGGADDIAGYAMAIATSWGMAYALLELGHVRIDVLRSRLSGRLRAVFDLTALLALAATVTMIALRGWPVLERSILNGSRSNSAMQTPLAWVQAPWFAGWVWFALVAWLTFICALWLVFRHDAKSAETVIGMQNETEVHS